MSVNIITVPKFLTAALAKIAVETTLDCLYKGQLKDTLNPHREQLHIVILVPGLIPDKLPLPSRHSLEAVVLYEHTLGDPKDFPYPFVEIAGSKASQLWYDWNDDRTEIIPHLLFPGAAPFWGGVKRRGIVVACSGVKPWIDKMISGMVADILVALAHNAWENSSDKADDELCFLP